MDEQENSIDELVRKLLDLKSDLKGEEAEAFEEMIRLAVRSAQEINEQEKKLLKSEGFDNFRELMKPQSSHAIVVGEKLDKLLNPPPKDE